MDEAAIVQVHGKSRPRGWFGSVFAAFGSVTVCFLAAGMVVLRALLDSKGGSIEKSLMRYNFVVLEPPTDSDFQIHGFYRTLLALMVKQQADIKMSPHDVPTGENFPRSEMVKCIIHRDFREDLQNTRPIYVIAAEAENPFMSAGRFPDNFFVDGV
jgi:hypothetical protein